MERVYVVGVGSTVFTRHPDRSFRELGREAVMAALADAGGEVSTQVDTVWFGNCAMNLWGQNNIRGQVALAPMLQDGTLPAGVPVLNVEGGCATGSLALHGAVQNLASGSADVAMAVGIEKAFFPGEPAKTLEMFLGGADRMHEGEWMAEVAAAAEAAGETFAPHPYRVPFVDVHALHARRHMEMYGTTIEQLAHIAAKNHAHGAANPRTTMRPARTADEVLADKPLLAPFTRSMCSPPSDGAAAVLLVSASKLATLPPAVRERAVEVRAQIVVGGTWRGLDEPNVLARAAERAWRASGVRPDQVGVSEVHDASSFCELQATELLGYCGPGEGGAFADSGATRLDGSCPVNPSGGLVAKGHPLGATGLGMIDELVRQLRGEAGAVQVPGEPTVGVQHNAGGMVGVDEALCSVTVLAR